MIAVGVALVVDGTAVGPLGAVTVVVLDSSMIYKDFPFCFNTLLLTFLLGVNGDLTLSLFNYLGELSSLCFGTDTFDTSTTSLFICFKNFSTLASLL